MTVRGVALPGRNLPFVQQASDKYEGVRRNEARRLS